MITNKRKTAKHEFSTKETTNVMVKTVKSAKEKAIFGKLTKIKGKNFKYKYTKHTQKRDLMSIS